MREEVAVGRTLRRQRRIRGLNLDHVARSLCLSVSTVSRIECGVRSPTIEEIFAFAAFYEIPVSALIAIRSGDSLDELFELSVDLPESDRKRLVRAAKRLREATARDSA